MRPVSEEKFEVAAANAAKRPLMIAYPCHYEPHNLEAMRRIRAKRYGKPRLVVTGGVVAE